MVINGNEKHEIAVEVLEALLVRLQKEIETLQSERQSIANVIHLIKGL